MIIYKATNKINGKIYIGQTVRRLDKRLFEHLNARYDCPFQRALKKYGKENFTFELIAFCDTKDKLNFLEEFYINFLNSKKPNGYNITDGGEGTPGIKRPDTSKRNQKLIGCNNHMFNRRYSEKELELFRNASSGSNNANYGKHWSETQKRLISEKVKISMMRPEIRGKFLSAVSNKSEEQRKKISESHLRLWQDPEYRRIHSFQSEETRRIRSESIKANLAHREKNLALSH